MAKTSAAIKHRVAPHNCRSNNARSRMRAAYHCRIRCRAYAAARCTLRRAAGARSQRRANAPRAAAEQLHSTSNQASACVTKRQSSIVSIFSEIMARSKAGNGVSTISSNNVIGENHAISGRRENISVSGKYRNSNVAVCRRGRAATKRRESSVAAKWRHLIITYGGNNIKMA